MDKVYSGEEVFLLTPLDRECLDRTIADIRATEVDLLKREKEALFEQLKKELGK